MKRTIAILLALMLMAFCPVYAAAPSCTYLNKNKLTSAPIAVGDTDYIQLREPFAALGYTISWDKATKTVSLYKGASYITLRVGSSAYSCSNNTSYLPSPILRSGSVMVPADIFKLIGYDVYRSGDEIIITSYTTTTTTEATTETTTAVPIRTGKGVTAFTGYVKSVSRKEIVVTKSGRKSSDRIDYTIANDAKLTAYTMNNTVMSPTELQVGDLVSVTLSPYVGTANIIRKLEH